VGLPMLVSHCNTCYNIGVLGPSQLEHRVTASRDRIPSGVIERLPLYLRVLVQLRQDGASTVSSASLGELSGVNPAQVRRDLSYFGTFGTRGIGYDISKLVRTVQHILGSDHIHRIALVGAGNLGSAIAGDAGLRKHGFVVSAVFDTDTAKIGSRIGDVLVRPVSEIPRAVKDLSIAIGVLAVPPEAAQEVSDELTDAGVEVILNYTPTLVRVRDGVLLHNTDPVRELLHTLYFMAKRDLEQNGSTAKSGRRGTIASQ